MLDGVTIEIIVGLVMSIAIAVIVMVSVGCAKAKRRLREHSDLRESAMRYHRA